MWAVRDLESRTFHQSLSPVTRSRRRLLSSQSTSVQACTRRDRYLQSLHAWPLFQEFGSLIQEFGSLIQEFGSSFRLESESVKDLTDAKVRRKRQQIDSESLAKAKVRRKRKFSEPRRWHGGEGGIDISISITLYPPTIAGCLDSRRDGMSAWVSCRRSH